jgi:hypothetical protein
MNLYKTLETNKGKTMKNHYSPTPDDIAKAIEKADLEADPSLSIESILAPFVAFFVVLSVIGMSYQLQSLIFFKIIFFVICLYWSAKGVIILVNNISRHVISPLINDVMKSSH